MIANFALRALSSAPRVLMTGATGQIGLELLPFLRERYGVENVIASDIKLPSKEFLDQGEFCYLDVRKRDDLKKIVVERGVDYVIHFATLLSAVGEQNPSLALDVNVRGIENVLEVAKETGVRVFCPSTIAVFGPTTPRVNTPDDINMRPTTIYGVTKVYLELLGEYYNAKFGVDFRSVRYPGIISNDSLPGGGTTDYAIEIYYEALKTGKYECFLGEDTALPMMYMPDCLRGSIEMLEAPNEKLKQRTYNLGAFSFSPKELAESIRKVIPGFECTYKPDFRQAIAATWPESIDDSKATEDWGWKPEFTVDSMTEDMIKHLKLKDL